MKMLMVAILAGLTAATAMAKEETLLSDSDSWQMYTRPEVSCTRIGGKTTALGSLSVGWMLNDKLSLGPTATANLSAINDDGGDIKRFDLWDAGLRAEYTLQASKLCHVSASLSVSGGNITVTAPNDSEDSTGFIAIEPGVNAAINIWDTVEVGVGVGYRFTDGADVGSHDNNDFQNFTGSIFVRLTEF